MGTITNFQGLSDWYVDTAKYNIDPNFKNYLLQDQREIDQRRLNGYKYFMEFYEGKHWDEKGEYNPAFGAKYYANEEFNRRTWNVSKAMVDKLVSFMVKEAWTVKIPQELEDGLDESEQAENNPFVKQLEAVWEANHREIFSYKMLLMGCITGDVFVKVSYDEDFYAPGIGELRFDVLDSRTVFPFFDAHDKDKMVGCRIQYPIWELVGGEKKEVIYTEIHTPGTIVYLLDGEVDQVVPNPLGELLVVHIKNEPLPFRRFGRSDLEPLIIPNRELNEKLSDFSEILAYHAAPVTIIKGAKVQQLQKGARKIWGGIPKDGDVYNLELTADLSSTIQYIELLKKHMHELSNVPEEALGALQNVSNTSGAALHVQYQPLLERIQAKQVSYGLGLTKLNAIILKFYEQTSALEFPPDLPPSLKYKTTIEWGDALPRDRSIDLADISTEMGLQIESRKGAMKRLGVENPEAKLMEIDEEQLMQAERDFLQAGLSGFGDPSAGPDGLGTSTGANDGTQNDVSGAVDAAKTNPVTQGSQTSVQAVKKSAQTSTGQNAKR